LTVYVSFHGLIRRVSSHSETVPDLTPFSLMILYSYSLLTQNEIPGYLQALPL